MRWENISDEPGEGVRRRAVPGGWLYQVEAQMVVESVSHDEARKFISGWHPPVFVPNKESR